MPHLPNAAARALQRQVQEGVFSPGTRLPGQRQLASDMGISRAALREAVSTLQALGMLRSQPGKGVYVAAGQPRASADMPAGPLDTDPKGVFDFRAVVEPGAASLAAAVASAADVARLEAIQREMENAIRANDLVAASEADLAFHLAVAAISGNKLLAEVVRSLEEPIAYSLRLPFADPEETWTPAREHRVVIDAIAARDSATAHAAMRSHIASAASRVGLAVELPPLTPANTPAQPRSHPNPRSSR